MTPAPAAGGGGRSTRAPPTATTNTASSLSPHAAPFSLPRHPLPAPHYSSGGGVGFAAGGGKAISSMLPGGGGGEGAALRPRPSYPLGRLQEGDATGLLDNGFVIYREDGSSNYNFPGEPIVTPDVLNHEGNSYSLLPTTSQRGTETFEAFHPTSTYGMYTGRLNSMSRNPLDFYPAITSSTSGVVFAPAVIVTSVPMKDNSLASGHFNGNNGSQNTVSNTVNLANKTQERNASSCNFTGQLDLRENSKSSKDVGRTASSPANSELSVPFDGKETFGHLVNCPKEANPGFSLKPLHISTSRASSCGSANDDTKQDSSECSIDSPCWKGASTFRKSSFDFVQTSAPQTVAKQLEATGATGEGQKSSSSTVQYAESLSELRNAANSSSNQKFAPSQVELCMSKEPGDVNKLSSGHDKDSHWKELELAKDRTGTHNVDRKIELELKNNCIKQSGLNSSAPDFVPSSIGKRKSRKGPCSSTKRNVSGILKAMQSLSEVLLNGFSDDEIELEEEDRSLLDSVIQNMETCLHETRKGLVKDVSNKSGPKAPHSQTIVSISDVRKCTSIYAAHGGKSETGADFTGCAKFSDFGDVNCSTRSQSGQPSQIFSNYCKRIPHGEEQSYVLLYKNLWIDAERANCELKYQLKCIRMKIDIESNKAHTEGPRNTSFQISDFSRDSAYRPTLDFLEDHPIEEFSSNRNGEILLPSTDCTHLAARDALHCSSSTEGYPVPKNLCSKHVRTGLEERNMHRHAQDELQIVQNKASGEFNTGISDGVGVCSYAAGRNVVLLGSSDYGSSDWEHVLKEELGLR